MERRMQQQQQQQPDEEDPEAAADAWLLDSLSLYHDLHLFELQDPTRVLEWTGEKSICVAGYENGRRNEILQLRLPQRLCAKANQGLCPERDFQVEYGGFSDRPIYVLKHIPETSWLVSSGPPDGSLELWHTAHGETDVIKNTGSIPTAPGDALSWAKIAMPPFKSPWVVHGQRTNNVQGTEIESRKTIFMAASASTEEVATLEFLDEATVMVCTAKGQLFLADTREPQGCLAAAADTPLLSTVGEQRWCAGARHGPPNSVAEKPLVARLSSGGHVVLTDLRNAAGPSGVARCHLPNPVPAGAEQFLTVSFAPLLRGCLAVSGFDGTVQVYDTSTWDPEGQEVTPVFTHQGHVFSSMGDPGEPPLVTVHRWHPSKPRTLLSAATDGSLHVWDWADQSRTS